MKKIALLALSALLLSGCSSTVTLEPADDANNPLCAEVIVRLPDAIDNQPKRVTSAQSTGAWGTPSTIIMRCGLPEVTASTMPCVTSAGVDWIVDDSKAPSFRFVTFGRNPATEVIVDSSKASGAATLDALASLMEFIPADKTCS